MLPSKSSIRVSNSHQIKYLGSPVKILIYTLTLKLNSYKDTDKDKNPIKHNITVIIENTATTLLSCHPVSSK